MTKHDIFFSVFFKIHVENGTSPFLRSAKPVTIFSTILGLCFPSFSLNSNFQRGSEVSTVIMNQSTAARPQSSTNHFLLCVHFTFCSLNEVIVGGLVYRLRSYANRNRLRAKFDLEVKRFAALDVSISKGKCRNTSIECLPCIIFFYLGL